MPYLITLGQVAIQYPDAWIDGWILKAKFPNFTGNCMTIAAMARPHIVNNYSCCSIINKKLNMLRSHIITGWLRYCSLLYVGRRKWIITNGSDTFYNRHYPNIFNIRDSVTLSSNSYHLIRSEAHGKPRLILVITKFIQGRGNLTRFGQLWLKNSHIHGHTERSSYTLSLKQCPTSNVPSEDRKSIFRNVYR